MALVIVTPPNPPGSKTEISPPVAVWVIVHAKVLQGAVRLHGLESLPVPETHVRVAWALADGTAKAKDAAARAIRRNLFLNIGAPLIAELTQAWRRSLSRCERGLAA
jgi:hypothetical protein